MPSPIFFLLKDKKKNYKALNLKSDAGERAVSTRLWWSEMSEQEFKRNEHQVEDELMDQVLAAMESAIGHKYVGYFPDKSMTRIKRIEPDNSILLDLYSSDTKARELIDIFINSGPEELAMKLGLPDQKEQTLPILHQSQLLINS